MTQRKTLLTIEMISDDDCGMYRIGEIDTLPNRAVEEHVLRFGKFGYDEWMDFFMGGICAARDARIKLMERDEEKACTDADKCL